MSLLSLLCFFFFKQKTAYEMRISDWSSDVCSSDLIAAALLTARARGAIALLNPAPANAPTTRDLLALADVTTPNETEFAGLVSRHVGERLDGDAVASLDQPHLHALCRDLLPAGTVVVTLGASGCFVSHADDEIGRAHV